MVECGLGGTSENFDALLLHTLPVPGRPCRDIWQPDEANRDGGRAERLAGRTRFYREVGEVLRCGHIELAGLSVAVPFVGAMAAALVVAEVLRMLHDGERFEAIDLRLASPGGIRARRVEGGYRGNRQPRLSCRPARTLPVLAGRA